MTQLRPYERETIWHYYMKHLDPPLCDIFSASMNAAVKEGSEGDALAAAMEVSRSATEAKERYRAPLKALRAAAQRAEAARSIEASEADRDAIVARLAANAARGDAEHGELVGRAEAAWTAAAAAAEAARLASASVRKDEAAQQRHFAEPVSRAFPRRKTVSGLAKVAFTL